MSFFRGPRFWDFKFWKFGVSWWFNGYPHSDKPYRLWVYFGRHHYRGFIAKEPTNGKS